MKPFKDSLRETWASFVRAGAVTSKGNIEKPSRPDAVDFISKTWVAVSGEVVARSFKRGRELSLPLRRFTRTKSPCRVPAHFLRQQSAALSRSNINDYSLIALKQRRLRRRLYADADAVGTAACT
ncbi:hypothetical protein MTO96_002736 [Rhipicephalus appendiculatus]